MPFILLTAEGGFFFALPGQGNSTGLDVILSWNSGSGMKFVSREGEDMIFSTVRALGIPSASLEPY